MHSARLCSLPALLAAAAIVFCFTGAGGEVPDVSQRKVYSILSSMIETLRREGITPENARVRNVRERYSSSAVPVDDKGNIGVLIVVDRVTPGLTNAITEAMGEIRSISADWKNISAVVPFGRIEQLARRDDVLIIRPLMGGTTSTGSVTSEGDSLHHAVDVRNDLNVKGDSINIGVISDGCSSWAQSMAAGDLPSDFTLANATFANGQMVGAGDEGTAMMEIVHDLAPNAKIYFYGALGVGGGIPTMVDAIQRLVREKGCRIVVDDLTYWGEPMFEDGTVATQGMVAAAAKWAVDTGVVYVSSAGNWAKGGFTDRSHYQSIFSDVNLLTTPPQPPPPGPPKPALPNGPIVPPFAAPFDNLHDFGTGMTDAGLRIITPSMGEASSTDLVVVLQWPNAWQAANDDYDLYLYDNNLNFKRAQSINVQDGTIAQDPFEIISLTHEPVRETLNVVINHFSKPLGAQDTLLGLYIYGALWVEYNTPQNSIWGHPGVPEVIASGAVPYNNINVIEQFSSIGNYDVYVPNYSSRPKPDVVGTDGVQITGVGGFPPGGGGRFYGTSAAAPHIAAMAGLLLSRCPAMTPAQVHSKFERTSVDLGAPGVDPVYGAGRADIERAMLELNLGSGVAGPITMNSTTNVPDFFATADGYAMNTMTITGGASQPATLTSTVTVTDGSPYASAGLVDLGCPSLKRWFNLTQSGGQGGLYSAAMTMYVDEAERSAAGIGVDSLQMIHWNGSTFEIITQSILSEQVGSTWKIRATVNNADLSPFFIGRLVRSVHAEAVQGNSGDRNSTVPVTFAVTNEGNGWDTLRLRVSDTRGWTFAPVDSGLALVSARTESVQVRVSIPAEGSVGDVDTLLFRAESVADSSKVDSALATVTVVSETTAIVCRMSEGWNMISVPLTVADYRKSALYPEAVSSAFGYSHGYYVEDTLEGCGGYWLKYADSTTIGISGIACTEDTVGVDAGWNMVGSISLPVDTAAVLQIPAGIVISRYFGYDGAYQFTDSIRPGGGYWVKCSEAGSLILKYEAGPTARPASPVKELLARLNTLTVTDARGRTRVLYVGTGGGDLSPGLFELPPLPPAGGFDARYASQRFVELLDPATRHGRFTVQMQTDAYPVTVRYKELDPAVRVMLDGSAAATQIIDGPLPAGLTVDVIGTAGGAIPATFALEQNFPNPFNPQTIIRYQIPVDCRVKITIYNLLGNVVELFDEGIQKAGYRSLEWNASDVVSGVYFCRLEAGSFVGTRKLTLLK